MKKNVIVKNVSKTSIPFLSILRTCSLLFILFFILFLIFVIIGHFKSFSRTRDIPSALYEYMELIPSKNETKYDSIRLPQQLLGEQYISYSNEKTGNRVFIKNFGGSKFKCTGSCHCTQNERRNAIVLLQRGLTVLFSAFSLLSAQLMAKEAFRDSCIKQFSDTCDPPNVQSTVDDCEETDDRLKPKYFFTCQGRCMENKDIDYRLRDRAKAYLEQIGDCDNYAMPPREIGFSEANLQYYEQPLSLGPVLRHAVTAFTVHLTMWCLEESLIPGTLDESVCTGGAISQNKHIICFKTPKKNDLEFVFDDEKEEKEEEM